jgi:hypothetical protein
MNSYTEIDVDDQWHNAYDTATNHAERLLTELVGHLHNAVDHQDWYWYEHNIQELKDVTDMLKNGDMMGYAERFIYQPED